MAFMRTFRPGAALRALRSAILAAASAAATLAPHASAQTATAIAIDPRGIGGTVRGPNGAEAGVWVIAETRDLPVRFIRIVVTDDQGRYLVPDLPAARYEVWVRGYGLVDSPKLVAEPGRVLDHVAVAAPDAGTAARIYPAIHWYSMLRIPSADAFGGRSDIPAGITRERWLHQMKSAGCIGCHQLGQLSTRTIPPAFAGLPHDQAWMQRVQAGQSGEQMLGQLGVLLGGAPFAYFGDWTARIAEGAVPPTRPSRPEGVERNIVVTLRDWMNEKQYLHDLIASDRRDPTVNAYGPLYGSPEYSTDEIPILDPVRNVATTFRLPVTPDTPEALGPGHAAAAEPLGPSAYWGEEKIWNSRANNHNSMFDQKGRVWMAATGHPPANPDFCRRGSDHPSAKLFPLERSQRRITMLDPKTGRYTAFQTCFQTHHLQFGYDADDTLWTSGGGPVVGWINTRLLDETGDIAKAQGWTAMVLDTNGNGKRDDHVEPNQPLDPTRDKRIQAGLYAVMPNPVDGSVWGTSFSFPGSVVRIVPGADPPATALTEIFNVPLPGFGPRGGDIDSQGVVWVSLSSGHLGSFDRRKCKGPLNGPTATGDHCPEGWSFHRYPGPGFEGIGENSAESSYYTWVDQHDTFGLGRDVPMSTGNLNDGLIAFKNGRMIVLRVPYPLGFYAKGFDGRIDDASAGWKGRGLWTTNGDRTPWLIEGGKGTKPLTAHFQLRPHPLAP